jgi:hypothetical protein
MAVLDITQLPGWVDAKDLTSTFNVGSLTVTKLQVFKIGSVFVFQFTMSDSSVNYLKVKCNGKVKVGGTDGTFETGTEIFWQA